MQHKKIAIRPDANLLKKAQIVFGTDLVTDAFVCTFVTMNTLDEDIAERLDQEQQQVARNCENEKLDYDGQVIRLKFCNGQTVEFENSEWASMTAVKMEPRRETNLEEIQQG